MSRVTIDRQAARKLGRGVGDRLTAIIDGVAASHGDKPVAEIEDELTRRMSMAGVTGGSWRSTAEAIAAGEVVELHAP
jgi:hypothetical protein